MSRIGKAAVVVPSGVDVNIAGSSLTVKGPKGTLTREFPAGVSIAREENTVVVSRDNDERDARARHGLVRTLVNNMMIGVTELTPRNSTSLASVSAPRRRARAS